MIYGGFVDGRGWPSRQPLPPKHGLLMMWPTVARFVTVAWRRPPPSWKRAQPDRRRWWGRRTTPTAAAATTTTTSPTRWNRTSRRPHPIETCAPCCGSSVWRRKRRAAAWNRCRNNTTGIGRRPFQSAQSSFLLEKSFLEKVVSSMI